MYTVFAVSHDDRYAAKTRTQKTRRKETRVLREAGNYYTKTGVDGLN